MNSKSFSADHLGRLEQLLAHERANYNTMAYIILEGPAQVTLYSLRRCVTVPVGSEDVGHLNTVLAEAALKRIEALEKELVEAHAQVVTEADDLQQDQDQLAAYRQQVRPAEDGTPPAESLQPLAATQS
ncbi:MAG: hypothetical protein ACRYG7_10295 [Janthinobacterium lividum]